MDPTSERLMEITAYLGKALDLLRAETASAQRREETRMRVARHRANRATTLPENESAPPLQRRSA